MPQTYGTLSLGTCVVVPTLFPRTAWFLELRHHVRNPSVLERARAVTTVITSSDRPVASARVRPRWQRTTTGLAPLKSQSCEWCSSSPGGRREESKWTKSTQTEDPMTRIRPRGDTGCPGSRGLARRTRSCARAWVKEFGFSLACSAHECTAAPEPGRVDVDELELVGAPARMPASSTNERRTVQPR